MPKLSRQLLVWGISAFSLTLFLIVSPVFGKTPPILSSGDHVWFATEHGLYRYDKSQDEWSVFSIGNGLAGNDIRDIGVDEDIIWIATNGGISNSDIRFSDWRSYTADDGIPDNSAQCVAFSEDYVWIGTDNGASRFDKLLEEWESFTQADGLIANEIRDIVVDDETVWFATSSGVSKFEVEFDRWTNYTNELPSTNVTWTLVIGEYVWFATDAGLARYDKRLRSWKSYTTADGIVSYEINDIIAGDTIWLATSEGISSYDSVSESWSEALEYQAMLPGKNVADLAMDGSIMWFSTDKGISSYDTEAGSWRHYTTADGLLDNKGQGIIVSGQVLVVTEKGVNLYDKSIQEWEVYEFPQRGSDTTDAGGDEGGLRLDERGIGFDLSRDAQVRLSGFSSLEFVDDSSLKPERVDEYEWDSESDLSLKATIPGDRSMVGFYDDTDEDDVEYGLTYRGNNTDFLQEATAGEFEARMRNSELIEDINLEGGGARLRKGFGNARLNVEPRYGRQRGYFETDFFVYKTGTTIYELSHRNIIPGTDEVRAGREKLQRGIDYLMVYPSGWLMFHKEELVEEGEDIEVRYQYEPVDDEYETRDLAIATTGLDIGDSHYIGLDMLHGDGLDVISLNGESKNVNMGPVSMKLRPEIAYSKSEEADGIASRAEFIANAPRTQFRADYERYGDDFWTIGRRKTRFGDMDQHIGLFSQIDAAQWMPLTVQWQRDRSSDDDNLTTSEDDASANIIISKESYPTISLTGERETVASSKQDETENTGRIDLKYDLPQSLLSQIAFRRAEVNGYYREARGEGIDQQNKTQTGYAKVNLYPMERFALTTSYKLNKTGSRGTDSVPYQLQNEVQRLLIRSNFASIGGIISTFHMDDLQFQDRTENGDLEKDKNRYIATSLNLIPGVWTKKLEMLKFAGTYSLIQQTVSVKASESEASAERADSNSRSLRLQANLEPHNTLLWTCTYERIKNWIESIPPVVNIQKYRTEAEFKPGSGHRIILEYYQEGEDENSSLQKRLYSPSLWWETRWSGSWTTRFRVFYQDERINEQEETLETDSTLTPSFSFRYTAKELPYGGRLYLSQGFSLSVSRAERIGKEFDSETYSTSSVVEWKLTKNLSFRLRGSVSYEDKHAQEEENEASANVYIRALAKF